MQGFDMWVKNKYIKRRLLSEDNPVNDEAENWPGNVILLYKWLICDDRY